MMRIKLYVRDAKKNVLCAFATQMGSKEEKVKKVGFSNELNIILETLPRGKKLSELEHT